MDCHGKNESTLSYDVRNKKYEGTMPQSYQLMYCALLTTERRRIGSLCNNNSNCIIALYISFLLEGIIFSLTKHGIRVKKAQSRQ